MVVDDNTATRRMVKNALQRNGHHVIEAPDGRTARELMASERPRIVIQDLMLPDADGFELVGELRTLAHDEVSILAFSGFVSKLDEARVSTVGFDDIIPKPIAPSRLVPLVEAHLPVPIANQDRFGSGRRLVVADDDPIQLKLATFRLSRFGFEVEAVPNGQAALAAARHAPPAAIVSDVMMPELDGFGLALAMRQDPSLQRVPLLLVTSSYVEPADRELARRTGANDLLLRTPDLGELVEVLRSSLATRNEAPRVVEAELADLERDRNRRVVKQLERQVMLNTGLAKRCSALASELTVLAGISDAVIDHRELDASFDDALATCFDAVGVPAGALFLRDDTSGAVRARAVGADVQWTDDQVLNLFGRPEVLRAVMDSRRALFIPGDPLPDARGLLNACNATALLLTPLHHGGRSLGALLMTSRNRELDRDDWTAFAAGVAQQLAQVLTLARAFRDREAAEARAASHAALLDAILANAPDVVFHIDLDGTLRFVNRDALGKRAAELVGTKWTDHVSGSDRDAVRTALAQVARGERAGFETRQIASGGPAGAAVWFSVRLSPVIETGKVVGAIVVSRDTTDMKQAEAQLMLADRMASVGTLAAGVAHEINNPLASVIANLDMAQQDIGQLQSRVAVPVDLVDELADARTAAERVREIVRDLKIFSRAEIENHRTPVDVEAVLDSTLRMAWNEIRHRARVVKVYGRVPRVAGHESRLGQVFLNLLVNACQAIPEGSYDKHEIRVSTSMLGDRVVVSIRDSGAGIPPDVRARLFTPFFTTKPVGVGTGLGLAISHKIVTNLGGDITFDSEVGKGTEFRVALPIADGPTVPIPRTRTDRDTTRRRGNLLVVDDEEILVHAIERGLAAHHEVTGMTSAVAALELVRSGKRYDAILCDLMMPQVTGIELYEAVRELDPAQARRIVFVTGGAFTATARQFLDASENPRIEKPFDLRELRALVDSMLAEAAAAAKS
jgi:PAS domain S-box-containing protein